MPVVLCRTKLTLTVEPDVNDVVAVPALLRVWAVLLSVDVLTITLELPVTEYVAVPTLLSESNALIVTLPEIVVGSVM